MGRPQRLDRAPTARAARVTGPGGADSGVAAVLDVGSNSVLLLVAACGSDGRLVEQARALETTQLGTGLAEGGLLDDAAMARTTAAVQRLVTSARAAGAAAVWGFATAAARVARDGAAFVRRLSAEAGIPIDVLSGADEARLSYRAVADAGIAAEGALLVVDIGGGTVELTIGRDGVITSSTSLPLGALRLMRLAEDGGWAAVRKHVRAALDAEPVVARAAGAGLAATGGTVTALVMLASGLTRYDLPMLHRRPIGRSTLEALCRRLEALPAEDRCRLPGLDPGRGRILPAGAIVALEVMRSMGADLLTSSEHGVRHAVLVERLAASGVHIDRGRPWRLP